MNEWERTVAWLASVGALVAIGRALTNKEALSWRVVVGRVILGSALANGRGGASDPVSRRPDAGAHRRRRRAGDLGEQVLELARAG